MTHRLITGATALAVGLLTHVHLAVAAPRGDSEDLPLHLPEPANQASGVPGGGGNGLVRTLIGLAVVVAVIYGLAWVLRQVKSSREGRGTGAGLTALASLPLGPNRAMHVVRAGREVLLLGAAEQQISQLGRYTEEEAEAAGLLDLDRPAAAGAAAKPGAAAGGAVVDRLRAWTVRR